MNEFEDWEYAEWMELEKKKNSTKKLAGLRYDERSPWDTHRQNSSWTNSSDDELVQEESFFMDLVWFGKEPH